MRELQSDLMRRLYGHDVWDGFVPDETSEEVQGWNGDHPSLERIAKINGAKIVIDVGVWKGQSTITLANALKSAGIDGCVIAVDTFLGSPEHWGAENNYFGRRNGQPDLFRTFLSNVDRAGVRDYVIPMPQTSATAALVLRRLGIKASVAHIDAAHEYSEVLRDAEEYWELLQPGGHLIGDDYHETWPGVVRAAGEFSARLCRPLTIEPPKWILQKPMP